MSKSIRASRMVAFEDLGMKALQEFELVDLPVTVAADASGRAIYAFNIYATQPFRNPSV